MRALSCLPWDRWTRIYLNKTFENCSRTSLVHFSTPLRLRGFGWSRTYASSQGSCLSWVKSRSVTPQEFLQQHFYCDGHADTFARVAFAGADFVTGEGTESFHIDHPKMKAAGLNLQLMAVYIPPRDRTPSGQRDGPCGLPSFCIGPVSDWVKPRLLFSAKAILSEWRREPVST